MHGDDSDPTVLSAFAPVSDSLRPLPHEPTHRPDLAPILERQGPHPFPLPQAVDRARLWAMRVLCRTCDAYSCILDGEGDADGVCDAARAAVPYGPPDHQCGRPRDLCEQRWLDRHPPRGGPSRWKAEGQRVPL